MQLNSMIILLYYLGTNLRSILRKFGTAYFGAWRKAIHILWTAKSQQAHFIIQAQLLLSSWTA